ncbi:hypothetical protein [Mesorhizobium sp. KR1-2]|uniref:hypothetical protein n=1 Tax=Mesorhizobium sp. KR1-2 TaxID=3156609 RepID=UPI0032B53BCE
MQVNEQKTKRGRDAFDIAVWENEGGALAQHSIYHNYGRRVEADGSWTIYHVFTGVPAVLEGRPMTGLERTEATATMVHLNARNAQKCKAAREAEVVRSGPGGS